MREWVLGLLMVSAMGTVAGCKKDGEPTPPARRVEAPRVVAATPTAQREAPPPGRPVAPTTVPAASPRPAWYPAGFALPAGWRAEGPVSVTPHATSGEIAWDKSLAEVVAEFQKELLATGWTMKSDEPRGKGGKRMRWEKSGETVQLSVFEVDGKTRAIVVPPIRFGAPPAMPAAPR